MARWFPGQQDLFDLLKLLTEEQVVQASEARAPLFRLRLPNSFEPATTLSCKRLENEIESAAVEEHYQALLARLDGLRTSEPQALVLFDLIPRHARLLSRCTPRELAQLARDPNVMLVPVVPIQYFVLAIFENINPRQRTVLARTSSNTRQLW